MKNTALILMLVLVLFSLPSCQKEIGDNACDIIENPENYVGKIINIDTVIVYDEYLMVFSNEECKQFDHNQKHISVAPDFANADFINYIYKSREISKNNFRYGSRMQISGTVKRHQSSEQGAYFVIEIHNYKKKYIVKF